MAVATAGATRFELAEFARDARLARLGALFLDSIVFFFLSLVVNNVYGVTQVYNWPSITIGGGTYATVVAWPAATALWILYFLIPEAMFGATPGKYWMRLRVVRLDGQPLDVGSVVARNLLRPVDALPLLYLLGGLLVLATGGAQRLGDLAAKTTVVHRHRALEPGATRTSRPVAGQVLVAVLSLAVLFTIAFDYFGRPPLVIEGNFNERLSFSTNITSYSLGSPTWGIGTVTYPLKLHTATQTCSGSVELQWSFLGWTEDQLGYVCPAS